MIPFTVASLLALVVKVTDFFKYLQNREYNPALTQAGVWVAGIFVVGLGTSAGLTQSIKVANTNLGSLDWASVVLLGMSVGSLGSVVFKDAIKAIDNHDSAAVPGLSLIKAKVRAKPKAQKAKRPVIDTAKLGESGQALVLVLFIVVAVALGLGGLVIRALLWIFLAWLLIGAFFWLTRPVRE